MKTIHFPYVALCFGLTLVLIVIKGSEVGNSGEVLLPLLTRLIMSEFAFFVTAIGAYIGVKHIYSTGIKPLYSLATGLCFLFSLYFLILGVSFWPK